MTAALKVWKPLLKPTVFAMCAGIMSLNSDCQSPNGVEKTTVTVLPPLEPVTDLIWLYPAVLAGSNALPPTSVYFGLPLCACQL